MGVNSITDINISTTTDCLCARQQYLLSSWRGNSPFAAYVTRLSGLKPTCSCASSRPWHAANLSHQGLSQEQAEAISGDV